MSDVKPQVKCDRCGKVEFKVKGPGNSDYTWTPRGWGKVNSKDLCDGCYEEFITLLDKFMGVRP